MNNSYYNYFLPNGLRVESFKMPHATSVSVNLLVNVGSRYESEQNNGITHFLEHMAFKGTTKHTYKEIAEIFDNIGGSFNAYTAKECTVYHMKILSEHLEISFNILSDILLNSTFLESEINKEYGVICQEISQTYDAPDERALEHLYSAMYPNSSLGRSILGTKETISNFDSTSFNDFVSSYYKASNMVLSVAGNINNADIEKLANRFFSNFHTGKIKQYEPANFESSVRYIKKDTEQTNTFIAFESISYMDINLSYRYQLLSIILGGGLSSILFQHIREKLGLAYAVGSSQSSYSDTGAMIIFGAIAHSNLPIYLKEVKALLSGIKISNSDLKRAKNQIRANLMMSAESTSHIASRLVKSYSRYKKFISNDFIIEKINSITLEEMQPDAEKLFTTRPAISVVGPKEIDYNNFIDSFSKI